MSCRRAYKFSSKLGVMILFLVLVYFLKVRYENDPFDKLMSDQEEALLNELFEVVVKCLSDSHILYFIHSGSLLGSLRHHGIVPWDDDIDLAVNISDKAIIEQQLKTLEPQYKIHKSRTRPSFWKIYMAGGIETHEKGHGFKWPFIDVFLFSENDTHIWESRPFGRSEFVNKKADVFPLVKRPFGKLFVNSPCNPIRVLEDDHVFISSDICNAGSSDHLGKHSTNFYRWQRRDCTSLYDRYPFVHRQKTEEGWREDLIFNRSILKTFLAPEYCNQH